ncbi:serine/threonine-protein kinase TBK1-like isoform X2 [Mercenaria mercenaria]|uniref:serine/threonine-protein kinase TBK1-like isoform X2 n=1 Tax=Mercenaria mercenaria TaxID=6596 RepID=UPI00234EA395|nr:serine/threonine-protein kinase TBK1-like isoform X2 [Mercenaria mercenaria]
MESKKLRATEYYVYHLDDLIGKGATCEVYKGIHKGTGEIHALKIFEHRLRGVAQREIEALKSLNHDNIVAFMGQETDRDTGRVVAVMEYCDKSLYMSLCEPENRYGLTEDEFIRFFRHIVEGMKHLREHGFLHRDIKPGNILIVQDQDGSNIYKLSDFGTAKPVLETEAFQSLVGTEEYLHPNIFRAAFIDQGMSREFDAAADLWSLGATLYHSVTGRVPFLPYQGRNNKALMFQMIAQKEFGVIAGEQRTQNGDVIWTKELPSTCKMSRWLKDALTEILKRLLEGDPNKAMTFDTFFMAADDILSRHIVYVFSTTSAKHFRLYLQKDCVFSDVQQEIYTETNIPPRDQLINYEECLLREIMSETDTVILYPKLSLATPLVLVRSTAVEQCIMPEEKHFWYSETLPVCSPSFPESVRHLDEDYRIAKSICDSIALVQSYIELGCLTQDLFEKTINRTERWKEVIVSRLQTEVDLYRDRVKDLRHIHKAIMENGVVQCVTTTVGLSIENLKSRINNCTIYMDTIKNMKTDCGIRVYMSGCVDGNKCQKKISRLLEQAKEKRNILETRKKQRRSLQYHEEQLQRFDRKQLTDLYNTALSLWSTHCQGKLKEVHNHFLNWHSSFAQLQAKMETLQKEIKTTKSTIKKYMRNFKVSSEPTSLMSTSSSMTCEAPVTMETEAKRRLDAVKSEQEEMKRMVSENDELHTKSMQMMTLEDFSDYPTLTSTESGQSTDSK